MSESTYESTGDVAVLTAEEQFSGTWMRRVPDDTPETPLNPRP